jgi:CheY-like chemotaxis protein
MTSSVTILLLDDEPLLRRATALILERHGATVTAAGTADEAVALTRERLYDVAVFDVSPPGPSVSDILRRIRADGLVPRRVIAVSSSPLDRREAEELSQLLPKPYPFDSLLRAVFGAGGRRRTRSGVFARAEPRAAVGRAFGGRLKRTEGLTARGSRAAARAGRARGG